MFMNEKDFNNMEFYNKLDCVYYICFDVKNKLKGMNKMGESQLYLTKLANSLEENVIVFAQDDELKNCEQISFIFSEILEITPLIKLGEAHYSYLIKMLSGLIYEIEKILPKNIMLAHFFQRLLNCKEEIAACLGVDENSFKDIIGRMTDNVDTIGDILAKNNEEKHKNSK